MTSSGRAARARSALALIGLSLGLLASGPARSAPEDVPSASVQAPAAGDVRAALVAIQRRYDGVRDFEADFVQTSFTAALGSETERRGRIAVKRPGQLRWEYEPPDAQVIVLDRETLRIYSPGEAQLQIAAVAAGAVSPTVLSFLLGDARLAERFDARRLPERGPAQPSALGLELQPRGEESFERLELWVDPDTYQLRESVIVDLFANRTQVRYTDVRENAGVDDARFELEVPEDTEVIDLR